jgi:predicted ATP-grasp superfamily ATP-dependent carboligase
MTLGRAAPPRGAVVLGADYRALGVVRSLGRHGIPVWVVGDGEDAMAAHSRFVARRLRWPALAGPDRLEHLLGMAQDGARGWALIPSADEAADFISRHHAALDGSFALTTPPWEVMRIASDKRETYARACALGVDVPRTLAPADRGALEAAAVDFPAIIKPAVKCRRNRLTAAKAWRVDDRAELLARYDEASALAAPGTLLVQELIPGDGRLQFSYCALCDDGRPLARLVARRTRQYPPAFGRASTYVETVECEEVVEPSERLLADLGWSGLVEAEYKLDPRDGRYKLLDLNPRVWGWHTLAGRAGVDFPYLLWLALRGEAVPPTRALTGIGWMRASTDVPMAALALLQGTLTPTAYVRSLRGPLEGAIFAADDPVPGLLELPLLVYKVIRRAADGGF